MPVDLDDLFTALSAHADRVPLGTAEEARRRGRLRRARSVAAGVAVLVLATAGVTAIAYQADPPAPPAEPTPRPTVTFMPLQPAGSLPMSLPPIEGEGPSGFRNRAIILDSVAYIVADSSGGTTTLLGALDLTTGRPVFPLVDLGESIGPVWIAATRAGLLARTTGTGDLPSFVVIDPATGHVRWHVPGYANVVITESALVTWNTDGSPLRGLDWRTGAERWRGPRVRAGGNVHAVYPADFRPLDLPSWPTVSVDLILAEDHDGTVHVVDASTGETMRTIDIGQLDVLTAIGDTLYAGDGGEVWAFPLRRPDPRALVYRDPDRRDAFVMPCGASARCLLRSTGRDQRLTLLDPVTHRELWQVTTAISGFVVGDRLLDENGFLYDLRSGTILGEPVPHHRTWWLTAGSVLTLDLEDGGAVVGGMYAENGNTVRLGTIPTPLGAGEGCAANQQYLVCPAADGFHAWRFATDESSPEPDRPH